MTRLITIGPTRVEDDADCYVIAEIGHNHQGSVEKAKALFRSARDCGVDAVKLQKRANRILFTQAIYEKPYDNENSFGATYGEHRDALEFDRDEYLELMCCAEDLGLTFFATAFDVRSVDFLADLGMPAYKIASGDLKNIPLLKHVSHVQKPVLLSTGGGEMEDVQRAYDAIMSINPQLCILQCTGAYPTDPEEMNLRVITTYRERFPDAVVGLSDHYNGIAMGPPAYLLGARVIEKHFTLNHAWKGTDHAMSLEPSGMKKLVRDLRRIRVALGDGVKSRLPSEADAMVKMGKSLVAAQDLPSGHVLTPQDVEIRTPGGGLFPYELENVVGRELQEPLQADDFIPRSLLDRRAPKKEQDDSKLVRHTAKARP